MSRKSTKILKRKILRGMTDFYENHSEARYADFICLDTVPNLPMGEKRLLNAYDELAAQGLIESGPGQMDGEGNNRLTVKLNILKLDEIAEIVRPYRFWEDPKFMVPTVISIFALATSIWKVLQPG